MHVGWRKKSIKASVDKDSSIYSYHSVHRIFMNVDKRIFILNYKNKTNVYREKANYPKLVYLLDLVHLLLLEGSNILLGGMEIFFQ